VKQAHALPQALVSIIGIASTYNPILSANASEMLTASGESYDAEAWTAAIQIDLRGQFGGVRYGRLYRPAFALIEHGSKRAIVRINDVGPLRPGRVIDLNDRAMRYFDPTMRLGLVHGVKISLLPGEDWIAGPVAEPLLADLASSR
jgi:rare lipoprotein A